MIEVVCPRCGIKMKWLRRMDTFICPNDGYLLGPNDPYLKRGEVIDPYNPGGSYNH